MTKAKASSEQLKSFSHLSQLEYQNLGDPFKVHYTNFENLSSELYHKELVEINIWSEINMSQVHEIVAAQERDPTFQNRDVYSGKLNIPEWVELTGLEFF